MHPMLNIAIRAIRTAGSLIIKKYETLESYNNNTKKSFNTCINSIIKEIENIIIKIISKSYPLHNFITTNKTLDYTQINNNVQWIIDPINNINNFIKLFPHFAISIAARIKGNTEIAVIYDPIRNELFSASRGRGAQLNGYRLRCSKNKNLENTMIATYVSKTKKKQIIYFLLNKLHVKCQEFRHTGSPLLDLAYVAVGRVDALFASGIKPYSLAGGELIIKESGGLINDFLGNHNYLISGNVIAGNAQITKEIILLVRIHLNKIKPKI